MSPTTAQLILASASPRRVELLRQLGLQFEVRPQSIDETQRHGEAAQDFVQRLAREKAEAGWEASEQTLPVLGADTIVVQGDEVFGKPRDEADALAMLRCLSGTQHVVMTAVALATLAGVSVALNQTRVRFRLISEAEMRAYWRSGEPADKAGAYAIQGQGGIFVQQLQGSYSAVVGLPLLETSEILRAAGISILDV